MKKTFVIKKVGNCRTEYSLIKMQGKKERVMFSFSNSFLGIKKVFGLIKRDKLSFQEGLNLMKIIYHLPIPIVRCKIHNEHHRVSITTEYKFRCLGLIDKVEKKIFNQITSFVKVGIN